MKIDISQAELREIQDDINRQFDTKQFRPVVVVMVENLHQDFLLIQSAKNHDYWGFPQGGVDTGEAASDAIARELFEEVGIEREEIWLKQFCGFDQLPIPNFNRDGLTEGKRYYFFHVIRTHGNRITLQEEEVSDYCWAPKDGISERLSKVAEEKRASLLRGFHNIR